MRKNGGRKDPGENQGNGNQRDGSEKNPSIRSGDKGVNKIWLGRNGKEENQKAVGLRKIL